MSDLLVPPLAVDSRSQAIDALAARITGLDLTPILVYLIDLVPSDALPFLAEQFNVVGPLWAYLKDETAKRRAIKESVAWHRAKGTPWSVETALSWAGHVATVEDTTGSANRWAEYQIELGAPVAGDALQAVLELARFAAPARSHLVRLYGGYDRRVLHGSTGDRWSEAFLSDDSGVWIDGVKLSFGRTLKLAAARPETFAALRLHRLHAMRALYPDILRWGNFAFGDVPVRNHPIMHGRLVGMSNRLALLDPVSLAGRRRMARAAVPLSEDARLGEPNTRFGGYAETATNRFFWSDPDSALSVFDPGRIRTPIDEVFIATHRLSGVANQQPRAANSRHALHASRADWRGQVRLDGTLRWSDAPLTEATGGLSVARLHTNHTVGIGERASRYTWSGGWDNRRWGGDLTLTHQTLTS